MGRDEISGIALIVTTAPGRPTVVDGYGMRRADLAQGLHPTEGAEDGRREEDDRLRHVTNERNVRRGNKLSVAHIQAVAGPAFSHRLLRQLLLRGARYEAQGVRQGRTHAQKQACITTAVSSLMPPPWIVV